MSKEAPIKKNKLHKSWSVIWRILASLILVALFLSFALQVPFIQKWGVKRITNYLTERMETDVSVKNFDLNIFDHLKLGEIYIKHPRKENDTLLYSKQVNIRFNNLLTIFQRKLAIEDISLKDGLLRFGRRSEEGGSTITYLLEKLSNARNKDLSNSDRQLKDENSDDKSESGSKTKNFDFSLKHIDLRNMRVSFTDSVKSTNQYFQLEQAEFDFDEINFGTKIIRANSIDIKNSSIKMVKYLPPNGLLEIEINEKPNIDLEKSASILENKNWSFFIDDLNIENIQFEFDDYKKSLKSPWAKNYVDIRHFKLDDIDISMNNFSMENLIFDAEIENIHIKHENGFEVEKISAGSAHLDENNLILEEWVLQTADSYLRDNISLKTNSYYSYEDVENALLIQLNTPGSRIAIDDLVRLVPNLSTSSFFQKNRNKIALLTGNLNGTINALNIQNMNLKLGGVQLIGDFKSQNLALGGTEKIQLSLDSSSFNAYDLEQIIPNLTIPENFENLGIVKFLGDFNGSFENFIASGDFKTALGNARANIEMNIIGGRQTASYAGALSLMNFDLKTFTNNEALGKVTLTTSIKNGLGLTEETATADLDGNIQSIIYNGYAYEDITLKGSLRQKLFDGSLSIQNENINLQFNGLLDRRDSIPNYIFEANAKNLDLYNLNLSNTPLIVSGEFDVNMRALDLDRLFGVAFGRNVEVIDSAGIEYKLDSFSVESSFNDIDLRSLVIESDVGSAKILGDYRVSEVIPLFKNHLKSEYPRFFPKMIIPDSVNYLADQRISFQMNIYDSKNWFDVLGIDGLRIKDLTLNGEIKSKQNEYKLDGFLQELHYLNWNLYNTNTQTVDIDGVVDNILTIQAGDFNEQVVFENILLDYGITNDSLIIHFETNDLLPNINKIDATAHVFPDDDHFSFYISPLRFEILDETWNIKEDNFVELWDDKLTIRNLSFTNGAQEIEIAQFGEKGFELKAAGFKIDYLNEIWDYEKLNFTGEYAGIFKLEDVFELENYSVEINSPALFINDTNYGVLDIDAKLGKLNQKTQLNISIDNGDQSIVGAGYLQLPLKEIPIEQHLDWKLDVDVNKLPMMFWQYIIGDNISDTEGYINADLTLDGKIDAINMNGVGRVFEGKTKVNFLGTTYYFDDQPINVTPDLIDLSGGILIDEAGNEAVITGGIEHKHIKDLTLAAVLSSPKFIGLKTTPEDNSSYYGYAIGRMYVTFNGLIDQPSIDVNAETGEGTYLAIPIDYGTTTAENDFVKFTTLTRDTIRPIVSEEVLIDGVDFTMNVTMNEGATVELIFNESSGEILRGSGNGDIQFSLTRNGEINMTGLYEIASGNYLFTNFFIRKPFVIQPGGTIRWNGNPLDAQINIEAEYERLRASTALFIEEYLINASSDARNDTALKTDVDLTLLLTGVLSQPEIDFKIRFPNLSGEVRGYVDSKMRILSSDPNAMLEQVMGLILTRSFLPTNTIVTSAGQVATSSLNNTLSELLSAQLSSYLSGFFDNAANSVDFINSIEFDVGIDVNPFGQVNPTTARSATDIFTDSGNELGGRFTSRLFNDRLNVELGGNITTDSPLATNGQYFAGDYLIEYDLTNNRRLKIKAYHRNTLTIEGRRNKFAVGLTYRREFDSFADLFLLRKKPVEN